MWRDRNTPVNLTEFLTGMFGNVGPSICNHAIWWTWLFWQKPDTWRFNYRKKQVSNTMPFQQKQCDYWASGHNLDLMPEAYLNLVSPQSWNTIRKSYQISLDPGMVYLPILTIKNQLNLGKPFKSTSNFCLVVHLILPSFTVFSFAPYICHCTGCLLATKESHSIGSSYNGSNLGESREDSLHLSGLLGVWVEWKIGMWNGRNIYEIMTVQTGEW